jgi:O-acetyl-ADP-ribose deacetylase (regulator of RNase III)
VKAGTAGFVGISQFLVERAGACCGCFHNFQPPSPRATMARVRIEAAQGDITKERVDAIVNAANSSLARGAGVCGAIFAAAGLELDAACAALGGCATGDAKVTPGFALPARFVVHAVGPVWQGGNEGEAGALASAYRRSLEAAAEAGARSIAFPAISTGIYGFPKRAAAQIAVETLRASEAPIELARLVAFDRETYDLYCELLAS